MSFPSGTVLLVLCSSIWCITSYASSNGVNYSPELVVSEDLDFFAFVNGNSAINGSCVKNLRGDNGTVICNLDEKDEKTGNRRIGETQNAACNVLTELPERFEVHGHQVKHGLLGGIDAVSGNEIRLKEREFKWYSAGPRINTSYAFSVRNQHEKMPEDESPSYTSWFVYQMQNAYTSTSVPTFSTTTTSTTSSITTRKEGKTDDEIVDEIIEAIERRKDAGQLIRRITAEIEALAKPFDGLERFQEDLLRGLEILIANDTVKAKDATIDLFRNTVQTLARKIWLVEDYEKLLDFISGIVSRIASRTEPNNTNITNVALEGSSPPILYRVQHRELEEDGAYSSHVQTSTVETKLNGRFVEGSIIITHLEFKNEKLKEEMIRKKYEEGPEKFSSDIVEFFVTLPSETSQSRSVPLSVDLYFARETMQAKRVAEHTCVFYNATKGELDSTGVSFEALADGRIRCQCNHTTSFGSIFIPNSFSENYEHALNVFSYIMDVFSLSALLLSILIFIFVRQIRTVLTVIHLNLCICLFVAELIIVFHNIAFSAFPGFKCGKPLGMLIHYSLLTVIAWSTLEGVYILQLMTVVFKPPKSHTRYYLMCGYIVPLIFPIIACPFSTYAAQSGQLCFLEHTMSSGLHWSFMAPLVIMLGVNCLAISTVMYRLYTINRNVKTVRSELLRYLRGILCMTALLGLQWGLGMASVFLIEGWNRIKFICIFLFVFFTLAQGPLIFVVHIMCVVETRNAVARFLAKQGHFPRYLANYLRPSPQTTEITAHASRKQPNESYGSFFIESFIVSSPDSSGIEHGHE